MDKMNLCTNELINDILDHQKKQFNTFKRTVVTCVSIMFIQTILIMILVLILFKK